MNKRMIYLGSDHAGFILKKKIKEYFNKKSIQYEDCGGEGKKDDDYPDYANKVGKKVAKNKDSLGILICGTGTGMVIASNKIKGIRASVGYDRYSVKMGRHDNNINILCLRGRNFSDKKNLSLVKIFLDEKFSNLQRHKRRIKKINELEINKI